MLLISKDLFDMDVNLQRRIDQVLGALICRILSLFDLKGRQSNRPIRIRRILIILLSEMGSLVLAYPMFQRLKTCYPDASISVLMFNKNREILEILGVVANDDIFTIDNSSITRLFKTTMSTLGRLRRCGFDVVVDCELFHRISSILSFLSRAPIRVGFHRHTQEGLYRGSFINRPVLYNPYQHISQQFITLADSIDSITFPKAKRVVTPLNILPPRVRLTQIETEEFRGRLESHAPGFAEKRMVLIYPGGGLLPIRAWPLESYCRLSMEILNEGYSIAIIGLEEDREIAQTIRSSCDHKDCIDLTGFTRTVRELMVLFHMAALLITNDGGPGQFSVLTPVPTIVFFGPETPVLYGPMDEKTFVFYSPISCSPCLSAYNHRNSPCDGDNLCLKSISVDQVFEKALELLKHQTSIA